MEWPDSQRSEDEPSPQVQPNSRSKSARKNTRENDSSAAENSHSAKSSSPVSGDTCSTANSSVDLEEEAGSSLAASSSLSRTSSASSSSASSIASSTAGSVSSSSATRRTTTTTTATSPDSSASSALSSCNSLIGGQTHHLQLHSRTCSSSPGSWRSHLGRRKRATARGERTCQAKRPRRQSGDSNYSPEPCAMPHCRSNGCGWARLSRRRRRRRRRHRCPCERAASRRTKVADNDIDKLAGSLSTRPADDIPVILSGRPASARRGRNLTQPSERSAMEPCGSSSIAVAHRLHNEEDPTVSSGGRVVVKCTCRQQQQQKRNNEEKTKKLPIRLLECCLAAETSSNLAHAGSRSRQRQTQRKIASSNKRAEGPAAGSAEMARSAAPRQASVDENRQSGGHKLDQDNDQQDKTRFREVREGEHEEELGSKIPPPGRQPCGPARNLLSPMDLVWRMPEARARSFTAASLSAGESSALAAQLSAAARSKSLCEPDKAQADSVGRLYLRGSASGVADSSRRNSRSKVADAFASQLRIAEIVGRRVSQLTLSAIGRIKSISSTNLESPTSSPPRWPAGSGHLWPLGDAKSGQPAGEFARQRRASSQRGPSRSVAVQMYNERRRELSARRRISDHTTGEPESAASQLIVPHQLNRPLSGSFDGRTMLESSRTAQRLSGSFNELGNSRQALSGEVEATETARDDDDQLHYSLGGVYVGPGGICSRRDAHEDADKWRQWATGGEQQSPVKTRRTGSVGAASWLRKPLTRFVSGGNAQALPQNATNLLTSRPANRDRPIVICVASQESPECIENLVPKKPSTNQSNQEQQETISKSSTQAATAAEAAERPVNLCNLLHYESRNNNNSSPINIFDSQGNVAQSALSPSGGASECGDLVAGGPQAGQLSIVEVMSSSAGKSMQGRSQNKTWISNFTQRVHNIGAGTSGGAASRGSLPSNPSNQEGSQKLKGSNANAKSKQASKRLTGAVQNNINIDDNNNNTTTDASTKVKLPLQLPPYLTKENRSSSLSGLPRYDAHADLSRSSTDLSCRSGTAAANASQSKCKHKVEGEFCLHPQPRLDDRFSSSSNELAATAELASPANHNKSLGSPSKACDFELWFRRSHRSNSHSGTSQPPQLSPSEASVAAAKSSSPVQSPPSGSYQVNSSEVFSFMNANAAAAAAAVASLLASASDQQQTPPSTGQFPSSGASGAPQNESSPYGANQRATCIHCQLIYELAVRSGQSPYLGQLEVCPYEEPKVRVPPLIYCQQAASQQSSVPPAPSVVLTVCSNQGTVDEDDADGGVDGLSSSTATADLPPASDRSVAALVGQQQGERRQKRHRHRAKNHHRRTHRHSHSSSFISLISGSSRNVLSASTCGQYHSSSRPELSQMGKTDEEESTATTTTATQKSDRFPEFTPSELASSACASSPTLSTTSSSTSRSISSSSSTSASSSSSASSSTSDNGAASSSSLTSTNSSSNGEQLASSSDDEDAKVSLSSEVDWKQAATGKPEPSQAAKVARQHTGDNEASKAERRKRRRRRRRIRRRRLRRQNARANRKAARQADQSLGDGSCEGSTNAAGFDNPLPGCVVCQQAPLLEVPVNKQARSASLDAPYLLKVPGPFDLGMGGAEAGGRVCETMRSDSGADGLLEVPTGKSNRSRSVDISLPTRPGESYVIIHRQQQQQIHSQQANNSLAVKPSAASRQTQASSFGPGKK